MTTLRISKPIGGGLACIHEVEYRCIYTALSTACGEARRKAREAKQLVWSHYHHFVLHRRTKKPVTKQVPGPRDPAWIKAAELASRRLVERPSYWIVGLIDGMAGMPTE